MTENPFVPSSHDAAAARDLDLEVAAPEAAFSAPISPVGDDPAAADDHDVLAHVLDEIELVAS